MFRKTASIFAAALLACAAFTVNAAGFDDLTLVTNDWFDASFTSLTVGTDIATNTATGITLGDGSWTSAPTNGTAKIAADGEATLLSIDAPGEELTFTPVALAPATGMETISIDMNTIPVAELSDPEGGAQAAFAIYSTNGVDHSLAAYVSDGTSAVWTNLVYANAADLTNAWFTLTLDFATVSNVRYVRYSITPPAGSLIVLADTAGTQWFRSADDDATTVQSVSFTGTGDIRTFSGDSLAEAVASYNGVNYTNFETAIAAGVADSWANGNVTLLADATWTPAATGAYHIDANSHALTIDGAVYTQSGNTYTVKQFTVFSEDFESSDPFAADWTWNGSAHEQAERTLIDGTMTSKFLHITATTGERGTYSFNSACTSLTDYKLEFDWFANMGYHNTTCHLQVYAGENELVHIADPNAMSSQNTTAYLYIDGADYNDKTKAVATFTTAGRGGNCTGTSGQSKWYHITITAYTAKGVFLKIESQDSDVGVVYEGRIAGFVNVTKISFAANSAKSTSTYGGIDNIVFSSIDVNGDAFVWTGAADDGGKWTTPGNWTVGGNVATRCPSIADTATIGADATIAVKGGAVLSTITIDPSSKLSVDVSSLRKSSYQNIVTNALLYAPGIAVGNIEISSDDLADEYDFDESGVINAVIWPKTALFWSGKGADTLWSNVSNWEYGEGTAAENAPTNNCSVVFPSKLTGGVEVGFSADTAVVDLIIDSEVSFDSDSSTLRTVYFNSISGPSVLSLGNIRLRNETSKSPTISCNIEIASSNASFYMRGAKSKITMTGDVSGSGTLTLDGDGNNGKNYVFTGSFADFTGTLTVPNNSDITFNFNGNDDTIDFADATVNVLGTMKLGGSYTDNKLKIGRLTGSGTINNATSNAMTLQVGSNGEDASSSVTLAGTATWTVEKVGTNRQTLTDSTVAYNATLTSGELCIPTNMVLGTVSVGSGKFAFDLDADTWLDGEAHTLFTCASGVEAGTLTAANVVLDLSAYTKATYATYDNTTDNQLSVTLAASSFTWVGGATNYWDDVANWQMNGAAATEVPRGGNAVTIDGATVIVSLTEDLTGVTLQNGAKIALPFTDSALTFTIPANLTSSDFMALGPYSISADGSTITATRTPSTFTWVGASGASWNSTDSWTISGLPVYALPGSSDTNYFPSALGAVTAVLDANTYIGTLTNETKLALTSLGTVYICDNPSGEGQFILSNVTFRTTSAKKSITISNAVEIPQDTIAKFEIYAAKNDNGYNFYLNGKLTGFGTIDSYSTQGGNNTYSGFHLDGDGSEFEGTVRLYSYASQKRDQHSISPSATSSNAVWRIYADVTPGEINSTMFASQTEANHATNYLGAAMIDFVSKTCGTYNVFEIGHLDQDSYITASHPNGGFGSNCEVHWIASTATYTNAAPGLKILNVCGGGNVVIASTNALPQRIMFSENGGTLKTRVVYDGETPIKIDPSSKLTKTRSVPITFDDEGVDYVWATALANSNTGGLVKKGDGTLTLKEVPAYTGDTYLQGGKLKIPASAGRRVKTTVEGKSVYRDSETIEGVEYTVYRLGKKRPLVLMIY